MAMQNRSKSNIDRVALRSTITGAASAVVAALAVVSVSGPVWLVAAGAVAAGGLGKALTNEIPDD